MQLFIIIDNEVVLETNSFLNGVFCIVGAQLVFNLEYGHKLKLCFKVLGEFIFGLPQKKRIKQYQNGIAKRLS